MNQLPEPLVPADVDLSDFPFMPLDVRRLRDSRFAATVSGDEFTAGLLLWCASWHQVPAASLPDDDIELSQLAGFGKVVREWKKLRPGALYGWVLCSDGRLYHATVAEKAIEAWESKLRHAYGKMCDRLRKLNKVRNEQHLPPTFEDWISGGRKDPVPPETKTSSNGIPPDKSGTSGGIPTENALKGQGQGQQENNPHTPKGAKSSAVGLKTWLDSVKAKGEKAIPDGDSVFAYAEEVALPPDFLRLAWMEFRHRYSQPDAKRYRDWRAVFRKAVRGNWLKLWWLDGQTFTLTTAGAQAQRSHQPKDAG